MKQSCKTNLYLILYVLGMFFFHNGIAQTYNDASIEYDIMVSGNTDTATVRLLSNAYMVLFIRGQQTRSELHTRLGTTITIYDEKKGDAVILHEYGSQHIMVRLTAEQYKTVNKKYANPLVLYQKKEKTIQGYSCQAVELKFQEGASYIAYYAPDLKFQTTYNGLPASLEGFPMEYESGLDGVKVIYTVRKINLEAVTANLFTVPDEGYRVVQFEELYKQ